jgi:restriction system protein
MPSIELSEETYQQLLRLATSFEDRPEDVIRRLLDSSRPDLPAPSAPRAEVPFRAAPGSVLPVEAYWVPILEVLLEMGGSAPSNDVVDALEERMKDQLTPADHLRLVSGETRWRNRARFARLRMKERGLLSSSSRRGVWEMTQRGRRYLEEESRH